MVYIKKYTIYTEPDGDYEEFSPEWIRHECQKRGISYSGLADAIGIHKATMWKIWVGKYPLSSYYHDAVRRHIHRYRARWTWEKAQKK